LHGNLVSRLLSRCTGDLAEGDSAIVRRDALVPRGPEAFLAQPPNRALGEILVLKAATGLRPNSRVTSRHFDP
jgi:hypothetical protein